MNPSGYRIADEMIVGARSGVVTTTYRSHTINQRSAPGDYTFDPTSTSYNYNRIYTCLVNSSGAEINYRNLVYFNPFGCNELYITQNKNAGSVIKVYTDNGDTLVFNGSAMTETGVTTYKVTAMYNITDNAYRYIISKLG